MTDEPTGGDLAQTLALLWRQPDPADRPARRSGLDVDRIVDTAVGLADAEGLAAVSMRRVATGLGTGAMSLYTHVPGKAALVSLMHDAVLRDLHPEPPAGHWRARLVTVARANWDLYVRHPWAAQVGTGRPVLGPHRMAKYDVELSAVDGLGLSEVQMDLVVTLVNAFVRGTVGGLHQIGSGAAGDEWWAVTQPHLGRAFDPARHPTAARVGPVAGQELGGYDAERSFEFGLERLLDGIGVLILNPAR